MMGTTTAISDSKCIAATNRMIIQIDTTAATPLFLGLAESDQPDPTPLLVWDGIGMLYHMLSCKRAVYREDLIYAVLAVQISASLSWSLIHVFSLFLFIPALLK